MAPDPTSQSNYLDVYSEHVSLKWTINWDKRIIFGSATHDLRVVKDGVAEVMYVLAIVGDDDLTVSRFDTLDLAIESVDVGGTTVSASISLPSQLRTISPIAV